MQEYIQNSSSAAILLCRVYPYEIVDQITLIQSWIISDFWSFKNLGGLEEWNTTESFKLLESGVEVVNVYIQ